MINLLLMIALNVQETRHSLYHSPEPWQQYRSVVRTRVLVTPNAIITHDTAGKSERWYTSASLIGSIKYGPYMVQQWIDSVATTTSAIQNDTTSITTYQLAESVITVHRRRTDGRVTKIETIESDEFYGDVPASYSYQDHKSINGVDVPHTIITSEFHGRIRDTITVLSASVPPERRYSVAGSASLSLEQYSPILHGVVIDQSDSRSMIVEFKDHLFVLGAPLRPQLGTQIIDLLSKSFPGKPVKRFAYSHFHNWYTGGIRAFVHEGAEIISQAPSSEFINYLVAVPRTICPDEQEADRMPLKQQVFKDSITIKDEGAELRLYTIGDDSKHTSDFSIMYVPADRILVVDDLVWIKRDEPLKPADERQRGLYNAIKRLNIPVETIYISWPLTRYGLKRSTSFGELEESVKLIPASN
jgi:hypothetical protein